MGKFIQMLMLITFYFMLLMILMGMTKQMGELTKMTIMTVYLTLLRGTQTLTETEFLTDWIETLIMMDVPIQ